MSTPPVWLIRSAHHDDIATIVEYNAAMAWETEGRALDRELLAAGVAAAVCDPHRCRYFVAVAGEHVIGQAMVTWEWSDWRNGWFWWLQSVYVQPEWRRQGVFRGLYRHVCCEAQQANCCGVRLYVEEHNQAAQGTYRRLGMADTGYRVFEETWKGSPVGP